MTDWKTYRGEGPWDFVEQPTKWGYLNNPKWSAQASGAAFSEKVGLPLNPDNHYPCGHWHKNPMLTEYVSIYSDWWQPSTDIYGGRIALVAIRAEYDGDDGLLAMVYDIAADEWSLWGFPNTMVTYGEPNTARFSNTGYLAWYGFVWEELPTGDEYHGRLYIFDGDGNHYYTDVFHDYGNPAYPLGINEWPWYYNVMDCHNDNIVVLARSTSGDIANNVFAEISHNRGITFSDRHIFPNETTYYDRAMIRVSEDGTFWVLFWTDTIFQLWKSNAAVTSFSKVYEHNYTAEVGASAWGLTNFDVSNADGQYVTVYMKGVYFYRSSDYGVSFTFVDHSATAIFTTYSSYHTYGFASDGQHTVLKRNTSAPFIVSDDYLATFHLVSDFAGLTGSNYIDMQKHDEEYVYTDCSNSFDGEYDDQGVIFSQDYGENWEASKSPASLWEHEGYVEQMLLSDEAVADEPQVWSME